MHIFELFNLNERINVNHTHTPFLNSFPTLNHAYPFPFSHRYLALSLLFPSPFYHQPLTLPSFPTTLNPSPNPNRNYSAILATLQITSYALGI